MTPVPRSMPFLLMSVTFFLLLVWRGTGSMGTVRQVASPRSYYAANAGALTVSTSYNNHRPIHVALVNTPHYHFEVLMPLARALGNQHYSHLDIFATRYGAARLQALPLIRKQVSPEFLPHSSGALKVQEPHVLRTTHVHYEVLVFTSCSRDFEFFDQDDFLNPDDPGAPQEILCIMHEAHEWGDNISLYREVAQPWINAGRITFIGLSPHVTNYMLERITTQFKMSKQAIDVFEDQSITENGFVRENANASTRVVTFPPVTEITEVEGVKDLEEVKTVEPSFGAIQGKYETDRRNYNTIIDTVANNTSTLQAHHASIRLLGIGDFPPDIPLSLKTLIYTHSGLSYPAFYALLGRANAILPAFAHDLYYVERASSTVAASVIAGTPIIANDDLVNAYAYLDSGCIWHREANESDVEAWVRVVAEGKEVWEAKKSHVRARRKAIVDQNLVLMERMLNMVRERMDRDDRTWS